VRGNGCHTVRRVDTFQMRLPWLFAREEYLRFFNGRYLTYPIGRFPHVESLHLEPISASIRDLRGITEWYHTQEEIKTENVKGIPELL
jgi:hypothetical protein